MAKKLTIKQKQHLRDIAYNEQFNELFKLHKYLVECPLTDHTVGNGNPVDDAIKLLDLLIDNPRSMHLRTISKLEKRVEKLSKPKWNSMDSAPMDGTEILLKLKNNCSHGFIVVVAMYDFPRDGQGKPFGQKTWVRRENSTFFSFYKMLDKDFLSWYPIQKEK